MPAIKAINPTFVASMDGSVRRWKATVTTTMSVKGPWNVAPTIAISMTILLVLTAAPSLVNSIMIYDYQHQSPQVCSSFAVQFVVRDLTL